MAGKCVFRPPATLSMLLSVFAGNDVQLICMLMSVATLTFTMLGILSPKNRGSLTTAFILLFVFMGSFVGYHSTRCKMFREKGNAPPWSRLCCLLHTELCSFDGRIQWCNSSLNILHPSFTLVLCLHWELLWLPCRGPYSRV